LSPAAGFSDSPNARAERLRRRLVALAGLVTILALIHHADHVIRGDLVVSNGLDPKWNHSGWPFQSPVTPFTASLAVYLILVPGIVFTLPRRLGAKYWIGAAIVLAAIIVIVHFVPGPQTETPAIIYGSYAESSGSVVAGLLALVDLFALLAGLLALLVVAIFARQASRRE
jgi:hypothetical protein